MLKFFNFQNLALTLVIMLIAWSYVSLFSVVLAG